ncbi:MAG: pseudouridine synthase [Cardiobacteriaceae bacterium]|nr:pseudouridine synthase [Cardiobacteriaceae bacterium]
MKLDIIHEDDDLLVVNKPAGLLSVPGRGDDKLDSIEHRARLYRPGAVAVHRLDQATSGLMMLACHKPAERFYKQAFAERQIGKSYQAICHGHLARDSGDIDLPLITDWPNRPKQKICFDTGKPSLTHYQVLERLANGTTRVRLVPHTGRSHQLRLHLAGIGHPIVGDHFYAYPADLQEPRLLLHAHTLQLSDRHHKTLAFTAPLPF